MVEVKLDELCIATWIWKTLALTALKAWMTEGREMGTPPNFQSTVFSSS